MKKGDFKNSTVRFARGEIDFVKECFAEKYPDVILQFRSFHVYLDKNDQLYIHFDISSRSISTEIQFINTVFTCLCSHFACNKNGESSIICDFITRRISLRLNLVEFFDLTIPF